MICLALTGGIACGKSELGRLLGLAGAETIDADVVVGRLHGPGGQAAELVAAEFGREYLLPDGATDKARLSRLVFSDAAARRRLEGALHPIVRKWLLDWKNRPGDPSSVRVAQIPLLFESAWSSDWDFTATVETSSVESRLGRLAARGLSKAEAEARIRLTAAPLNSLRLGLPTPCAEHGECADCRSERRICNITTVISRRPPLAEFHVLIVGEELGF